MSKLLLVIFPYSAIFCVLLCNDRISVTLYCIKKQTSRQNMLKKQPQKRAQRAFKPNGNSWELPQNNDLCSIPWCLLVGILVCPITSLTQTTRLCVSLTAQVVWQTILKDSTRKHVNVSTINAYSWMKEFLVTSWDGQQNAVMHGMFTVNISRISYIIKILSIHTYQQELSSGLLFNKQNIKKHRYKTWINELLSQAHSFYRAEGFPQDDARPTGSHPSQLHSSSPWFLRDVEVMTCKNSSRWMLVSNSKSLTAFEDTAGIQKSNKKWTNIELL